jgi:hypothetical protein
LRAAAAKTEERLCVTPFLQNPLNLAADQEPGFCPVQARHEQLVIARVAVANRGGDGEPERSRVEGPAGGAATHPAAATSARVTSDLLGPIARTAREEANDLLLTISDFDD